MIQEQCENCINAQHYQDGELPNVFENVVREEEETFNFLQQNQPYDMHFFMRDFSNISNNSLFFHSSPLQTPSSSVIRKEKKKIKKAARNQNNRKKIIKKVPKTKKSIRFIHKDNAKQESSFQRSNGSQINIQGSIQSHQISFVEQNFLLESSSQKLCENYIGQLLARFNEPAKTNAKSDVNILNKISEFEENRLYRCDVKKQNQCFPRRSMGYLRQMTKVITSIILKNSSHVITCRKLHQQLSAELQKNICFNEGKQNNTFKRAYDILNVLKAVQFLTVPQTSSDRVYKKHSILNPALSPSCILNLHENMFFHKLEQIERRKEIIRQLQTLQSERLKKNIKQRLKSNKNVCVKIIYVSKQTLLQKLQEGINERNTQILENKKYILDSKFELPDMSKKKRGRKKKVRIEVQPLKIEKTLEDEIFEESNMI